MNAMENELRNSRLAKLARLREENINPYPYRFDVSHKNKDLHEKYKDLENEVVTEDVVQVAGRIMSVRNSGMFIDMHDVTDKIQIFTHLEGLDDEVYKILPNLDIGDHIGVEGVIRRTKRGELTVNTSRIWILTKTLLPLPEKYHGLQDIEVRYRQRYLDLIMNPESKERLRNRSKIVSSLRAYLTDLGFLEVETPMLHPIPGGAAAKPFVTHHNTLDMDMFLRIAPELYLKRLVVGGLWDKVFEINRSFRNEGISPRHNPEFTMMELYQSYADYHDMMTLTENIVSHLAEKVLGSTVVNYQGKEIDLKGPWARKSMTELVLEKTGIDFLKLNVDEARQAVKSLHIAVDKNAPWGKCVELVFGEKVENSLIQPTHVIDLPFDISPLAKVHQKDSRLTERFETYINTWEIANAFSELTDPIDQKARLDAQVDAREGGDDEAHLMDHDFICALEYGLPPTGGLGIGIDRLIMILTDAPSIRDVIAFPTLRKI